MFANALSLLRRRWLPIGAALVAVALIIVAVVLGPSRPDSNVPSSTPTPSATQTESANQEPVFQVDDEFTQRVYEFVAAYHLPSSKERNELLKPLCTSEGFEQVYRDPSTASNAEKLAGNVGIAVIPESSELVANPFDDNTDALSVVVTPTVRMTKNGFSTTLLLPQMIMSWVLQDGVWKLAYLQ